LTGPDQYVLGYRRAEQERLQQLAQQLAHESRWLFDQVGVTAGARVVEIGCGPHGCLELLAERVGPSGSVVGVERSQDACELARELPRGSFDFVTASLVLVNVPNPEQIVAEAIGLVRPGGWAAFHEADWIAHVCDPPSHAWTTLIDLFVTYSEKNGIDPFIGRRLPRLLRDAGLEDVHVNPLIHVYPPGHGRRHILLDFAENLSERLVAEGLIREQALAELKTALRLHIDNPGTLVVSHLYFQAWGRKSV
jgi:SAM-dependent methyltransferase